ncbi:tRNA dimethylallyltransferase-like isoform X2 [Argopecten irradians]|uniref:tRNA dimethylallyltransferase-like isoform X2 n=1 Tax=Argopecten irradians TaxID=31199 RepID=UPI003721B040
MAASMRLPVVVILGSTGTGKSKLALELGKIFNGEIISADSMQVYKGLDIITNKVTSEELKQCPHHMINFLSPLTRNYTVTDYRDATLPIIDGLLRQEKLPIIVGGTSYYIESLLWNFIVTKQDIDKAAKDSQNPAKRQKISKLEPPVDLSKKAGLFPLHSGTTQEVTDRSTDLHGNQDTFPEGSSESERLNEDIGVNVIDTVKPRLYEFGDEMSTDQEKYEGIDSDVLYARLKEVDPEIARTLHPNNRRKIARALEIYDTHKVTMSSVYRAQRSQLPNQAPSGPLRFQNTCVFWLQSDLQELGRRTDQRVDTMIERGLVDELHGLSSAVKRRPLKGRKNSVADYTHGIFQSIGFKEFHDYLILSKEEQSTDKGRQLFKEGVENLKRRTRAYAKYQVKHIRNRYIKRRGANTIPVYELDVSDVSQWEDKVKIPAVEILTDILQGREPSHAPIPYEETDNHHIHEVCDICDGRIFYTSNEWQSHLKSKKHENRKWKLRKEQAKLLNSANAENTSTESFQVSEKGENSILHNSVAMGDNSNTSVSLDGSQQSDSECKVREDVKRSNHPDRDDCVKGDNSIQERTENSVTSNDVS